MRPILAFAVAITLASCAVAEERPVEIPLKEVCAYQMPGTQDVGKLDEGQAQGFLVEPILKTLQRHPREPERAFAVEGEGLEALRNVYKVRVAGEDPPKHLPAGKKMSIVFFSYLDQPAVQLHHVEREGMEIVIRYRFRPREELGLTSHFALIPMKLPPGKYQVKIVESPMAKKYVDLGFRPIPKSAALEVICRPFEFIVK